MATACAQMEVEGNTGKALRGGEPTVFSVTVAEQRWLSLDVICRQTWAVGMSGNDSINMLDSGDEL